VEILSLPRQASLPTGKALVGRNKTTQAQRMVAFPAQEPYRCRKRFTRLRSKSLIPAYRYYPQLSTGKKRPYKRLTVSSNTECENHKNYQAL